MDDSEEISKALDGILVACAPLSPQDRLVALQMAWLVNAQNARDAALAVPGGFPAEQSRQLEQLEKMATFVIGAEPDLELERLRHEGDLDGVLRHLRKLTDDARTDQEKKD